MIVFSNLIWCGGVGKDGPARARVCVCVSERETERERIVIKNKHCLVPVNYKVFLKQYDISQIITHLERPRVFFFFFFFFFFNV